MSKDDFSAIFVPRAGLVEPIIMYKDKINLSVLFWNANINERCVASRKLYEKMRNDGIFDKLIKPEIELTSIDATDYFFHPRDTKEIFEKLQQELPGDKIPMTNETRARLQQLEELGQRAADKWEGEKVGELVHSLTSFVENHQNAMIHAKRRMADIGGILDAVQQFLIEENKYKESVGVATKESVGVATNTETCVTKRRRTHSQITEANENGWTISRLEK